MPGRSSTSAPRQVAATGRPKQALRRAPRAGRAAEEAHKLRVAGKSWTEIAALTGYASGQVAQMAVTAYLQKCALAIEPELRRAALQTELDRLDVLHGAFWPLALKGDVRAAQTVLKIMEGRTRLLGLDRPAAIPLDRPQTFIVSDGDDMADQLREIADRAAAAKATGQTP